MQSQVCQIQRNSRFKDRWSRVVGKWDDYSVMGKLPNLSKSCFLINKVEMIVSNSQGCCKDYVQFANAWPIGLKLLSSGIPDAPALEPRFSPVIPWSPLLGFCPWIPAWWLRFCLPRLPWYSTALPTCLAASSCCMLVMNLPLPQVSVLTENCF